MIGGFRVSTLIVFGLIALVFHLRRSATASLVGKREILTLEQIRNSFSLHVPQELLDEVFQTIAKQLNVCPGQLRPSDALKEIFKVDSWHLGETQDALEVLIRTKTQHRLPALHTIQDLLDWLSQAQQSTG